MAINFRLSEITTEEIAQMSIKNLESIVKEFGFSIISREKRGTMAFVFINPSWRDILGIQQNRAEIDLRDLVAKIIAVWNAPENQPDANADSIPAFWDDEINPFGRVGNGTLEALELMSQTPEFAPIESEPTIESPEPTVKRQIEKTVYLNLAKSRQQSRLASQSQPEPTEAQENAKSDYFAVRYDPEHTQQFLASLGAPTEQTITIRVESENAGMNGNPTALIISDNYLNQSIASSLLRGYSVGSVITCRASVYSVSGVTSIAIKEIIPAPIPSIGKTAFSPFAIGAIAATIKVINQTGKFEILESSSVNDLPIGKQGNSTLIVPKSLGTIWAITCHLTDKGSIKIDSITEPNAASVAPIPAPIPSMPTAPLSSGSVPSVTTIESPIPAPEPTIELTADIDLWECPDYYISPDAREVFKYTYALLRDNPRSSGKILMTGESGYGKTTIAERFAKYVGFDCYRMNCAVVRDTEEWFFDREVKTKIVLLPDGTYGFAPETIFNVSEFAQRIAKGNCVIILDEFNRLESNLHNSLFPLLDDAGKTTIHHIDFTVGQNVIFVATVNLGAKFVGTFLLDDALTNRFDMILEVKPMPFDHECAVIKANFGVPEPETESIVRMATILRENEYACSTRDTLKMSRMVGAGMSIRDAFEYRVVRRIPEDESNAPLRKSLVDLINKELGERDNRFSTPS